MQTARTIRMNVVMDDLSTLVDACCRAGWQIEDTGERITTEEGLDGEAVVVVTVPAEREPRAAYVTAVRSR